VGLCLGIISGRLIISFCYPMLITRFLGVVQPLKNMLRPAGVTIMLFSTSVGLDMFFSDAIKSEVAGWFSFVLFAGVTGLFMLWISFYAGLSGDQRRIILRRVKAVLATFRAS